MGHPTWIYHRTEDPKLVDSDDTKDYYASGWADSPAVFIKTQEAVIPAREKTGKDKKKKGRK